MKLKPFFKKCQEKEVFKMLTIYVVVSWVLLQVMAVTWQALGLPLKAGTYLIILLLLGFPLYIFFIWKSRIAPLEKEALILEENEIKEKLDFKRTYFSSLGIITAIIIVCVVLIINKNFVRQVELPKVVQSNKIAVLRFGNNTGDPAYDVVSKMASDWIMHGITENQAGQVISQEVVNEYTSALRGKNSEEGVTSVVNEYLRPGKIITGNFYLKNNNLLFQCIIKDGISDETLIAFKPSECNTNEALVCIDDIKESILGFLMTEGSKKEMLQDSPPKYEAYKYFLEAKNTQENETYLQLLNKAIQADSTYFEPKVLRVAYFYDTGNYEKADSLLNAIEPDSQNNKRQVNLLQTYDALLKGNNKKVYSTTLKEYEIAPFDLKSNKSAMVVALQFVNRPEDVQNIFDVIKMDSMDLQNCPDCISRIYVKALADIELKNYKSSIKLLEPLIETAPETFLKKPLIAAYVRSGSHFKTEKLINEIELLSPVDVFDNMCLYTAKEYLLAENTLKANEYLDKIIKASKETSDKTILAEALYYKREYGIAEKLLGEALLKEPENIDILAELAICSHHLNKPKQVEKYLKNIETQRGKYKYGSIDYALAQFYAITKNTTEMNAHLMKAVAEGHMYTSQTFQNDPHFIKYKNTQPFINILTFWH